MHSAGSVRGIVAQIPVIISAPELAPAPANSEVLRAGVHFTGNLWRRHETGTARCPRRTGGLLQ